jgi:hypothetical protein
VVKMRNLPWGWSLTVGPVAIVIFRSPHEGVMLRVGRWQTPAIFLR